MHKDLQLIINSLWNNSLINLSTDQINLCDKEISKEDLYKAMESISNDKSPGNDGLNKEFYKTFWDDIKEKYIKSMKQTFHKMF